MSLDVRDAAILRAVWQVYGDGLNPSFRDLIAATGMPLATLSFRITGTNYGNGRRRGGGLVAQGWLRQDYNIAHSIAPGPRFGGLGKDGRIYEAIGWELPAECSKISVLNAPALVAQPGAWQERISAHA